MAGDKLEFEGTVERFAHETFFVKIDNDIIIQCNLSGKMRMSGIKLAIGDKVKVETSPYDPEKGRITYRLK